MPITNHTPSRTQVVSGSEHIRASEESAPMGATNHTAGVLNLRGNSGSRTRSTSTPIETITKASSVPIETRLAASRIGKMAAKNATTTPVTIVVIHGVRNFG